MVNKYFRGNIDNPEEQNLYQGIVDEAIQVRGMDVYYLPRTQVNTNTVLGEDTASAFNAAFTIEMLLENVQGFEGDKNFLSQLGLIIQKQMNLIVSDRRFNEEINKGVNNYPPSTPVVRVRPKEGDLIYFPLTRGLFEIKFCDHETQFYQLGKIYAWRLTCEMFKYSNETFGTGIPEIDAIATTFVNNNSTAHDVLADNDALKTKLDAVLDSNEPADPFSLKNY
jgi:Virus neck protein